MKRVFDASKFTKLPDVIFFDLDNTLYSYDKANMAGMSALEQKFLDKLKISKPVFKKSFLEARTQVKRLLIGQAGSHSRLLYIKRMLENLGLGSQITLSLELEQTYWGAFLYETHLYPQVTDLLDELRLMSIPTAIITNLTTQIQFRKILYLGLEGYFDFVITSEEAGHEKPHISPFILAKDKISNSASNIWMVGDDLESDINGSKKAIGATTILMAKISTLKKQTNLDALDAVVESFIDLRKIINEIPKG